MSRNSSGSVTSEDPGGNALRMPGGGAGPLRRGRERGRRALVPLLYRLAAEMEKRAGVKVSRARRPAPPGSPAPAARARPRREPGAAPPRPYGRVAASARPPRNPAADRLLTEPVFVLSPPRSGSTLLRVVLNSHPELHAPIETHVRRLTVKATTEPARQALKELGHNMADVEHLLWDRLLHRELLRSGKATMVEKTPSNVFVADRLATAWPDARFIFLLRHPLSIARSWHDGDPERRPMNRAVQHTLKYMTAVERMRRELPGITLRYERLTSDPAGETRRLCDFLGIPWESGMITYGQQDHGTFRKGVGDWKDKIRTGTVQPGRPLPAPGEIPEELREISRSWGYLPADAPADGPPSRSRDR